MSHLVVIYFLLATFFSGGEIVSSVAANDTKAELSFFLPLKFNLFQLFARFSQMWMS
jgi:hypothetical protein